MEFAGLAFHLYMYIRMNETFTMPGRLFYI